MVVHQVYERHYYTTDAINSVLLIACIFLVYVLRDYLKAVVLAFRLPGPPALPLIGNTLLLIKESLLTDNCANAFRDYGGVLRVWVLFMPLFVILEPADIHAVLSSKKHTDKIFFYKLLHNFLGAGLITSSGEKWRTHRKLIQPTFHKSILEKFTETFVDSAEMFVEKLENAPAELNIVHVVNECILDILNEAVLGVAVKRENKSEMTESPFRQGKVVATYRMTRPWLLFNWYYKMTDTAAAELDHKKKLDEFTRKMIDDRRTAMAATEPTPGNRKCLLDYMIEISQNNVDFTEEDIINEACTFMLAGQDSVGAAVAFCLFLLAQHPEHQQLCVAELKSIFDTDTRSPTMDDLCEMRYLERCIKETLRMYPSVPLIARRISEPLRFGKNTLPTGAMVAIIPYSTHRLPHIYPEPERFDPDRFLPDNVSQQHPYAFLPFSAGPRNCIGYKFAYLEMKCVISNVLRNFELLPVAGKTRIEPVFRITVRARGGLWIKLRPRKIADSP